MILTVTLNTAVDKLYVIDSLRPHEVMRVKEVNNTAGGKGMNVSRVAALAGEPVIATGFVGGCNGKLFESLITEKGITKRFTPVQAETRCCINIRDLAENKSTEFLEPGNPVTEGELNRFIENYETELQKAQVVTISGSMPKGAPTDFYAMLTRLAQKYHKRVILDTSGTALQQALPACPTMIKPNADEIEQLLKVNIRSRGQLIDAARQLHQSGIKIVAVSLGKDGVLVACDEGIYHGITPDIPVVNTVGCGDSMVAGFAVCMARDYSMEDTIRYAVAISTASALTKETGSFRPEDLESLLPMIKLNKIDEKE